MRRAILAVQFEVKYIYCGKCGTKPLDLSQSKVEKFLKDHAGHATNFGEYPRIVGYIKTPKFLQKKKVSIQFLKEKDRCKYKHCSNFSKKATGFCSQLCIEKNIERERRKKKSKKNRRKK